MCWNTCGRRVTRWWLRQRRVGTVVLHRLGRVLEGRAPQVAAGMRGSATKRRLATRKREPVDRCANYLLKYQGYLAYDQYLAAGFPIGSGVIKGACRHLVNDRLGITGARWRLRGAEAVLRLRALRSSGDFDDYWRFHEAQEWQRTHRQRYADGQLPALQQPNNGAPPAHRPGLASANSGPSPVPSLTTPNPSTDSPAYVAARASVPRASRHSIAVCSIRLTE